MFRQAKRYNWILGTLSACHRRSRWFFSLSLSRPSICLHHAVIVRDWWNRISFVASMTDFFNSMWLFTVAYNWLLLLLLLPLFGVVFSPCRSVHSTYASLIRFDKLSISVRSAMPWFLTESWSMLVTLCRISLSLPVCSHRHRFTQGRRRRRRVLLPSQRVGSGCAFHSWWGLCLSIGYFVYGSIWLFYSFRCVCKSIFSRSVRRDAFVLVSDCMWVTEFLCIKIWLQACSMFFGSVEIISFVYLLTESKFIEWRTGPSRKWPK